ncbi:conserved hypothetical protein [Bradyrhizobium sp. STM 3843]|uniref:hypothetical protein n=1 Tax=Bradyrhizobium sp. STM 3843 TaxID=551947 RepID=UPI0002407781|nr:hypothetical protein [Bradyrhizobium sp. STM 3843]CCE07329.1 conserved hypothetical protein [Bradyrhizobium sp. STM 3843]
MSDANVPSPNNVGYQGAADPTTAGDQFNAMSFIAKQILAGAWTVTLAQVKSVTNAGEAKDTGTVSLQPLVNQLDGQGNATPHGTISNALYFRYAGGNGAVICDPVVGDIGIMLSASSDISSVKANKSQANPGSSRKFDPADAIYLGAVLSAAPTQYITFTSTGLKAADKNGNVLEFKNGGIFVIGNMTVQGDIHASGTITGDTDVVAAGISGKNHTHGGVSQGQSNTQPPH